MSTEASDDGPQFFSTSMKRQSNLWTSDASCYALLRGGHVNPEPLLAARDSFGLSGVFRALIDPFHRGGGGNIFVVDLADRRIYGKVPVFPYDVRKFSRELRAKFQGLFESN
jgi:hypothetical protein